MTARKKRKGGWRARLQKDSRDTLSHEGEFRVQSSEYRVQSTELVRLNIGSRAFVITISSVLCTLNSVLSFCVKVFNTSRSTEPIRCRKKKPVRLFASRALLLPFFVGAFFVFISRFQLHQAAAAHAGAIVQLIAGFALGQAAVINVFCGFLRFRHTAEHTCHVFFIILRERFPKQALFAEHWHIT